MKRQNAVLTTAMSDFNKGIIEEFRAKGGKLDGPFAGARILLLHHTGAKTGTERVNPVAYRPVDHGFAVFASKAGAPTNPDWYHNLVAHPRTRVEVGTDTIDVVARVAGADEREGIWDAQKSDSPAFAAYEDKTTRQIPVVILEPV